MPTAMSIMLNAAEKLPTPVTGSTEQILEEWPVGFAAIDENRQVKFASTTAKECLSNLKQSRIDNTGQLVLVRGCKLGVAIALRLGNVTIAGSGKPTVFRLFYPEQASAQEVLLIADTPRTPFAELAEHYGLSAAESKVARQLMDGRTLEDIATQRDITKHTVRTQLRSIFKKTGTHRQGELISLMLANG